ncbi:MAG: imelysin family protein [Pseudomonadota bacterium]
MRRRAPARTIGLGAALFGLALAGAFVQPSLAAKGKSETFDYAGVAETALKQHIRPGYAAFANSLAALSKRTAPCADAPAAFNYAALRKPFANVVAAWAGVAHLIFGPITANNRYDRIFFWLDRKGIARRQVYRALKSMPAGYRDPDVLGERSIGVQGFTAIEILMLDKRAASADPGFRCDYLRAVIANVLGIARNVASAWSADGLASKTWRSAGPGNPAYVKPGEPVLRLVRSLMTATTELRDVELLRPLGFGKGRRKRSGPFARSDLTIDYIAARLAALRSAWVDSGLSAETKRLGAARGRDEVVNAAKQVDFEMKFMAARGIGMRGTPDFFNSDRVQEAIALGFPLKSARELIEKSVSAVTDLPFGFNAADGD